MATLNKQIWTKQLMKNFYPEASFLNYAKDFSNLVEYDKLHMAEVGIDPTVLINNTTYPITVSERIDKPIEFELDLFETENTLIREPQAIELAYDKLESVIYGHKQSLRSSTFKKAAHAYAPDKDSDYTPVIQTTGTANADGYLSLTPTDILRLKRRYDDMDIPQEGRFLVLNPRHTEDLINFDMKIFKDITDYISGTPKRFAGFNILEYSKTPVYNPVTLQKVAFDSFDSVDPDGLFSSFSFHQDEIMKADGNVKMYADKDDPKERATIIGFEKRFIALPIRKKAIGAIVAKKA